MYMQYILILNIFAVIVLCLRQDVIIEIQLSSFKISIKNNLQPEIRLILPMQGWALKASLGSRTLVTL